MRYKLVTSLDDLSEHLDQIIPAARAMIARTGEHGQTADRLVGLMSRMAATDDSFLMLGFSDDDRLDGFIFALFLHDLNRPWVEVLAIWTRPGKAFPVRGEVWDILRSWAKSKGAVKVIAAITRSPEVFFNHFHRHLGFKMTGWIVEAEL